MSWSDSPESSGSWDVVCGSVWTENEVRSLADEARAKGAPLSSAEVPLAFTVNPDSRPASVFVPGQIAMPQDDPLAEEFSDFIPMKAYLTRAEAEQGEDNWDVVWEFPLPWVGRFMLSPFTLDHYPDDRMDPHKSSR